GGYPLVWREQEEPVLGWSRFADSHDLAPVIERPRAVKAVATSLVQQGPQVLHPLLAIPHEVARPHAWVIVGDGPIAHARASQDCSACVDRVSAPLFIPP